MQNAKFGKRKTFSNFHFQFSIAIRLCGFDGSGTAARLRLDLAEPIPQGNQLNAIHFAKDKQIGVAVGSDSTIVRTTDGGFTWQRFTSPVDSTLTGVFVKDKKHAVIVGTRGTIMTLVDGQFWQPVAINTKEHLYGLTFTGSTSNVGWAVGSHGTILKTVDGGATWAGQNSGSAEHLARVAAFDEESAAAAGSNGVILITNDGGATWRASTPCGSEQMTGIAFSDKQRIIAAGFKGCIARSDDAGATWTRPSTYTRADFLAISFSNSKTGSATDTNGLVWMTGDGGSTWLPFNVRTNPKLSDVFFVDNYTGWAVGRKWAYHTYRRRRLQLATAGQRRARRH
jgi:photosystem II stability/assembly factor-like uncharacterized protein